MAATKHTTQARTWRTTVCMFSWVLDVDWIGSSFWILHSMDKRFVTSRKFVFIRSRQYFHLLFIHPNFIKLKYSIRWMSILQKIYVVFGVFVNFVWKMQQTKLYALPRTVTALGKLVCTTCSITVGCALWSEWWWNCWKYKSVCCSVVHACKWNVSDDRLSFIIISSKSTFYEGEYVRPIFS